MKWIGWMVKGAALVALAGALIAQAPNEAIMSMAQDVQQNIRRLPNFGVFDDIGFGIKGSTVILRGYASRPTLKQDAGRVTEKVKGVGEVVNQIEVLPLSNSDDQIRADVYVAIYGHSALSRYNPNRGTPLFRSLTRMTFGITHDPPPGNHPIHIIVNRGRVTLEGVVDRAGAKVIAGIQANSVAGVFSVTNDLVVLSELKKGSS